MTFLSAKAIGLSVTWIYFVAIVPLASLVLILPIYTIGVLEGTYILLFARFGVSPTDALWHWHRYEPGEAQQRMPSATKGVWRHLARRGWRIAVLYGISIH